MPIPQDSASMAVFCDFENVALGVRDANYARLDIRLVLERLLLKGSIVVKKAYCNWDRYKEFKEGMHEANFEMIEIPHVRQSGKNSADIRLVVDALDLCYTKAHVDTFVIVSGDSDFSPLVSKLRENAKRVIGVGVKRSTSDLLVANCDEFIFYDDLERERRRAAESRHPVVVPLVPATPAAVAQPNIDEAEKRRQQALEILVQTFDALTTEEGDSQRIWASTLKSAIKRRKPDFTESYYGFKAFGQLLEEAQARGLLALGRDEKSGTYVSRAATPNLAVRPAGGRSRPARREANGGRQERAGLGRQRQPARPVAIEGADTSPQAVGAAMAASGASTVAPGEPQRDQDRDQTRSRPPGRQRRGARLAPPDSARPGHGPMADASDTALSPAAAVEKQHEPRVWLDERDGRTGNDGMSSHRESDAHAPQTAESHGGDTPRPVAGHASSRKGARGLDESAGDGDRSEPLVDRPVEARPAADPADAASAPDKPARKAAKRATKRAAKPEANVQGETPTKTVKRARPAKKARPAVDE
ncbi:NYN domain-containing protein [Bordetella genomosp. 13]|uniref:NYN domain-containing protein n=1 Tax=Bordetella genomosp. 13 TaxID=463040 RepID=UPI0011A08EBA|nr:NYN domain-containing protein [Bordetella genomosp. 13]